MRFHERDSGRGCFGVEHQVRRVLFFFGLDEDDFVFPELGQPQSINADSPCNHELSTLFACEQRVELQRVDYFPQVGFLFSRRERRLFLAGDSVLIFRRHIFRETFYRVLAVLPAQTVRHLSQHLLLALAQRTQV